MDNLIEVDYVIENEIITFRSDKHPGKATVVSIPKGIKKILIEYLGEKLCIIHTPNQKESGVVFQDNENSIHLSFYVTEIKFDMPKQSHYNCHNNRIEVGTKYSVNTLEILVKGFEEVNGFIMAITDYGNINIDLLDHLKEK